MRVAENWDFAPNSREEIVHDLLLVHSQTYRLVARFDDRGFFRALGTGWSPAQNVVHLTKSVRPVSNALGLPKLFLRLLFGRSKNGSTRYAALRDRYQGILATGGGAGRFTPRQMPLPSNPGEVRARLVEGLADGVEELARRVGTWSETDLDRYRLPHPLLGKLTVREMLFFTVQHLAHHASKVEARLVTSG
jgi:hypothetical protein